MKKNYPKNRLIRLLLLLLVVFTYHACRKLEPEPQTNPDRAVRASATSAAAPTDPLLDSIERPTVLGVQLPNPYTIDNMRRAYQNIKGNSTGAVATHYYVRFKPTPAQIAILEEDLDLELFDEPLDYQIAREGDYYQDPTVPLEEVTWQYTVVPTSFSFPTGVAYQNLATIHLPTDLSVEAEAERLAGLNADGDGLATNTGAARQDAPAGGVVDGPITNLPYCPDGQWDAESRTCVPYCPNGWRWNGIECVDPDATPPPPPQPQIQLRDTRLGIQGLRKARVVAKRWFKIDRVFTDDNGKFTLTKSFRKKVKINVKFKNADAIVRGMRGVRLWQMLFPLKYKVGTFQIGDINRVLYTFERNSVINSKGNRFWVGATTHNAVQQMRQLASQQGIGLPPGKLKIILTNWGKAFGGGAAPMFAKRFVNTLPEAFIRTMLLGALNPTAGMVSAVGEVLKGQVDITYSYNVRYLEFLDSDDVCETIYHELCHAAHYQKLGEGWYKAFVNAEVAEIAATLGSAQSPYGGGTNPDRSPIIALGEGWAYHMGRMLADGRYGQASSDQFTEAGARIGNLSGWSAHRRVIELFNPNLARDPHRWIPKGIMWDLIDENNETRPQNFITDRVNGYTNQQFFNALDDDVRSIPAFRDRLLQENNNRQQAQVNDLFREYNY